jgi:hypothetical protein
LVNTLLNQDETIQTDDCAVVDVEHPPPAPTPRKGDPSRQTRTRRDQATLLASLRNRLTLSMPRVRLIVI